MLLTSIGTPSRITHFDQIATNANYRPDIDGLRAIAVLAVLVFHIDPKLLPGGFAGVDVFFVISGFLISGIIVRELERGRFSFTKFYARRVRRIFPALILVLLTVWVAGWLLLLPDEFRRLGKHMMAGALFSINYIFYQNTDPYFMLGQQQLTHLWSLGVEEQFYLGWPLVLVASWGLGHGRFILAIIAITTCSFALNIAQIPWDPLASFYLPWGRLWELSLGTVVAYFMVAKRGASARRWVAARWSQDQTKLSMHIAGAVGMLLLLASVTVLKNTSVHPGVQALAPTLGAAFSIAAGPQSLVNRLFLASPYMIRVGLISYPLYLWHWPLLSFAHLISGGPVSGIVLLGVVTAAFILAFITYRYVELPIRNSARREESAVALVMLVIVLAAIGFLTHTSRVPARSRSAVVSEFERAAENWLTGSHDASWTAIVPQFLVLGEGSRRVLYVGDSFVQHYYPRIAKLLEDNPRNSHSAVFAVRGGCIPLLGTESPFGRAACVKHGDLALEYARRPDVDTIVIGAAWIGAFTQLREGRYILHKDTHHILAPLKDAIIDLKGRGKRVYIILVSPMHRKLNPRAMIRRVILPPGFKVELAPAPLKSEVGSFIGDTNNILKELAEQTGAHVIEPIRFLCNAEVCPSVSSVGLPIYVDGAHLRPSYAKDHVKFLDDTILDP